MSKRRKFIVLMGSEYSYITAKHECKVMDIYPTMSRFMALLKADSLQRSNSGNHYWVYEICASREADNEFIWAGLLE